MGRRFKPAQSGCSRLIADGRQLIAMPIHNVIFDFGNVLCFAPRPGDFEPLYRTSGIGEARFQRAFWGHRLEYDRGTMDGSSYWQTIAADAGVKLSPAQVTELIAGDIALWQKFNPAIIAWNQTLRAAKIKTAVLSNMPVDLASYLRKDSAWMKQFDVTIFSAELGLLKPEAEIYAHCLAALEAKAEESLFIDDNADNVEGARAAGIKALQFESSDRLASDIEPYSLPPIRRAK